MGEKVHNLADSALVLESAKCAFRAVRSGSLLNVMDLQERAVFTRMARAVHAHVWELINGENAPTPPTGDTVGDNVGNE